MRLLAFYHYTIYNNSKSFFASYMKPNFSIVVPVYKGESSLKELCTRIIKSVKKITSSFEIILVNDGSPDLSWERISVLTQKDKRIKGVNLSRNFGQHIAITAGVQHARGKWIVVMDCDLQDPPEEIGTLYRKAIEGFDVVFGIRQNRKDSLFRRLAAKVFFRFLDMLSGTKTNDKAGNFCICNETVIQEYKKTKEKIRSFSVLIRWLGFKQTYIPVTHHARYYGKSSYTTSTLFSLALDYITLFAVRPLRISIIVGTFIVMVSFGYIIYLVCSLLITKTPIVLNNVIIASLYTMFGFTYVFLGILGLYIGNILIETRNRPLYFIKSSIGLNTENN